MADEAPPPDPHQKFTDDDLINFGFFLPPVECTVTWRDEGSRQQSSKFSRIVPAALPQHQSTSFISQQSSFSQIIPTPPLTCSRTSHQLQERKTGIYKFREEIKQMRLNGEFPSASAPASTTLFANSAIQADLVVGTWSQTKKRLRCKRMFQRVEFEDENDTNSIEKKMKK